MFRLFILKIIQSTFPFIERSCKSIIYPPYNDDINFNYHDVLPTFICRFALLQIILRSYSTFITSLLRQVTIPLKIDTVTIKKEILSPAHITITFSRSLGA